MAASERSRREPGPVRSGREAGSGSVSVGVMRRALLAALGFVVVLAVAIPYWHLVGEPLRAGTSSGIFGW